MSRLDRDIIGPGSWYVIHLACHDSVFEGTRETKALAINLIELIKKRFFCERCRKHFIKFCELNPPELSGNLFHWSVDSHNAVNQMNGKRLVSYDEAEDLYNPYGVCTDPKCEQEESSRTLATPSNSQTLVRAPSSSSQTHSLTLKPEGEGKNPRINFFTPRS
jgi:hypothetical protein